MSNGPIRVSNDDDKDSLKMINDRIKLKSEMGMTQRLHTMKSIEGINNSNIRFGNI